MSGDGASRWTWTAARAVKEGRLKFFVGMGTSVAEELGEDGASDGAAARMLAAVLFYRLGIKHIDRSV